MRERQLGKAGSREAASHGIKQEKTIAKSAGVLRVVEDEVFGVWKVNGRSRALVWYVPGGAFEWAAKGLGRDAKDALSGWNRRVARLGPRTRSTNDLALTMDFCNSCEETDQVCAQRCKKENKHDQTSRVYI